MNLSGLLSLLAGRRAYSHLAEVARGEARVVAASIVDPAKPLVVAGLLRDLGRTMLVVVASENRARDLAQQLVAWTGDAETVSLLPAPEPLPYERLPSHPSTAQARLRALRRLVTPGSPGLVVASVRALMRPVMAAETFRGLSQVVRSGDRLRPGELVARLLDLGYSGEALVEYPGTYSRRGGIVDVFPIDAANPSRIEFFGDEVETIRRFDPTTQRSQRETTNLVVSPSREVLPGTPDALAALRTIDTHGLSEAVAAQWDRDLERLGDGSGFDGLEFYAPYLADHQVLDYLPKDALVLLDEPRNVAAAARDFAAQAEELRAEATARGELPAQFRTAYVGWDQLNAALPRFARLQLSWHEGDEATDGTSPAERSLGRLPDFRPVPSYAGQLHAALDDLNRWRAAGITTLLVSQQSGRLAEVLAEQGLSAAVLSNVAEAPEPGALLLVHGSLGEGFELTAGPHGGLAVLTDRELFGWTKPARTAPARRPNRDAFLSELTPGDYVVHVEHGVGRFARMLRMATATGEREYLVLEYAAGDKLYVPADQTDRVTRYVGVGDHTPTLHRLGTSDWARTRTRVKAAVQELAAEMLRLYAARQVKVGHAFSPDTVWQRELEEAFPYAETVDQLRAINEVKADMEVPRPMDRLLCGDVGYGKTEVALRAAFKAIGDGYQVAVLVPTTVLAQQHYNTFRERLQAFPVRVEMLSRFRSEKEQRQVLDGLAAGQVDLCIGTHRLVQKDVQFKNLGLVIVDEEQRFGVLHKEHLKRLRTEVDVLTLTATPIPRTLHMALVGVRDLSVMETPPEDRLPIKTTVSAYDEGLMREVILRELDRGGQVYFVHNRVQTIYQMAHRLGELVPHASIAVGHGQLPEEHLEKVMLDFAAGRYDILVCSTIIESGLDIPNVNTIVVNQADRFGLAQLYQLRGRVGRGANRAYAYFLTPKDRQLSEIAEKRLRTIFEATDLGAGYRIAMKDLEIRGAGNLLGAEQHGHVAAVGFHLYTQLLAEAVKSLQGEAVVVPLSVSIDLPLDAYLPASYVADEQARLNLYGRLANLTDAGQVGELMLELRDRFGELPEAALNLIYLVQLKLLAQAAGIVKISTDEDQIVLQFAESRRADAASLQHRFGPLVAVGRSQVRVSRSRAGVNWLATLQDIVDAASGSAQPASNGRVAALPAAPKPVAEPPPAVSRPTRTAPRRRVHGSTPANRHRP
jgi:transcription-repair coupling factor (superfamily II helicase)